MRRDLADVFCTTAEGVRASAPSTGSWWTRSRRRSQWDEYGPKKARVNSAPARPPCDATGRRADAAGARRTKTIGIAYRHVDVALDRAARTREITLAAPEARARESAEMRGAGAELLAAALARELDDAILRPAHQRAGARLLVLRSEGDAGAVLAIDATPRDASDHWFVREVRLY